MKTRHLLIILILPFYSILAQDNLLNTILENHADSLVKSILIESDKYKVQIVYTRIDRNDNQEPSLNTWLLHEENDEYFYPASSVKFPAALVAMEKLNELNIDGLNKYSPLTIDSVYSGQSKVESDTTAENEKPSIAHYIKKILLVSDNDAYNRIYEFCGIDYLNKTLWQKGYEDVRLNHRLSIFLSDDENRNTNPFTFYKDNEIIYSQPAAEGIVNFDKKYKNNLLGIGYYSGGKLINKPMDFSRKNYFSLSDQHEILKAVIFPEAVETSRQFNLTDEDYDFLYRNMIYYPREAGYPKYDPEHYPDYYAEFFAFDKSNFNIRTLGKSGLAYGFLIDNAYVIDLEKNIEYLLTATIHVNSDGIYNDDQYEYDNIGLPFMRGISEAIYKYEIERERLNSPDLSKFENYIK